MISQEKEQKMNIFWEIGIALIILGMGLAAGFWIGKGSQKSVTMEQNTPQQQNAAELENEVCRERGHVPVKGTAMIGINWDAPKIVDLPNKTVRVYKTFDPKKYRYCERCEKVLSGWEEHEEVIWERSQDSIGRIPPKKWQPKP